MKEKICFIMFLLLPGSPFCFAQSSGQYHGNTGTLLRYDNFSPAEKTTRSNSGSEPSNNGHRATSENLGYSYITSFPPDGTAEYRYENTTRYNGEWVDGRRNGTGTMHYWGGDYWTGEWVNDKKNGAGTEYKNDKVTQGYWQDDVYIGHDPAKIPVLRVPVSGQGSHTYPDGSVYTGNWEKFEMSGHGTMTWVDGSKYEGEWYKGYRNGKGVMTMADGSLFKGQWHLNDRWYAGTLTYKDGSKFEGQWGYDKQHGEGKLYDPQGKIIKEGIWENGEYKGPVPVKIVKEEPKEEIALPLPDDGVASYTWPGEAKATYTGRWKNGKRNGQGIFTDSYGDRRVGEWVDDEMVSGLDSSFMGGKYIGAFKGGHREGMGRSYNKQGELLDSGYWENDRFLSAQEEKYTGPLVNGKKSGRGVMTFHNGSKYEGEWKDDLKSGEGIQTELDGSIYDGSWENGMREGKGTMIYADHTKYVGQWYRGQRHGKGSLYNDHGNLDVKGKWVYGQYYGK